MDNKLRELHERFDNDRSQLENEMRRLKDALNHRTRDG